MSEAILFPGQGAQFAGMGRVVGVQFPRVLHRQQSESHQLRSQYSPDVFWADGIPARATARQFLFGQVTLGTLVSDTLVSLGLKPTALVGKSLGESAGLFGLRVWLNRPASLNALDTDVLSGIADVFTDETAFPYCSVNQMRPAPSCVMPDGAEFAARPATGRAVATPAVVMLARDPLLRNAIHRSPPLTEVIAAGPDEPPGRANDVTSPVAASADGAATAPARSVEMRVSPMTGEIRDRNDMRSTVAQVHEITRHPVRAVGVFAPKPPRRPRWLEMGLNGPILQPSGSRRRCVGTGRRGVVGSDS